jgi:hypothetical protein
MQPKREITPQMVFNAITKEMEPYRLAAKFHVDALMSPDVSMEEVAIHQEALTGIFLECPLLLDLLIHEGEAAGEAIPEPLAGMDFRNELIVLASEQMENIIRKLLKEVK